MNNNRNRIMQIACVLLFRYFEHISIKYVEYGPFDLEVSFIDSPNLKFGVVVTKEEQFLDLSHADSDDGVDVPVYLMRVKEVDETAIIGLISNKIYGHKYIYEHPKFEKISKNICGKIKKTVEFLSPEIRMIDGELRGFEKKIVVRKKTDSGSYFLGKYIYYRRLYEGYMMRHVETVKEESQISRYIHGIPECEYPSDILDHIIFDSIKSKYSDIENISIETKTVEVMFNTDVKNIQLYLNALRQKVVVLIKPEIDYENKTLLNNIGTEGIEVKLDYIYNLIASKKYVVDNVFYSMKFDSILQYHELLNLVHNTYKPLSDYIIK